MALSGFLACMNIFFSLCKGFTGELPVLDGSAGWILINSFTFLSFGKNMFSVRKKMKRNFAAAHRTVFRGGGKQFGCGGSNHQLGMGKDENAVMTHIEW